MAKINDLFFTRPWGVKEDTLRVMSEIIERHVSGSKLSREEIEARTQASKKPAAPDYEVSDGVAYVPIQGVIAKRASMVGNISQPMGTSVEQITRNLKAALKDNDVQKIVLNIDSPGGSVDGIDELSDMIYSARGKKKILAYVDGQMCSAAYWIGSAAEKIFATKSSEVGSIGVYSVVRDYSVMEHNEGVKTEIIKAGKNKAAGHPSKPLTEDDRASIQSEVNTYYEMFVEAVARNRGISLAQALELASGKVFIGKKAQEIGLIDGIEGLEARSDSKPAPVPGLKSEAPTDKVSEGGPIKQTTEVESMSFDLKSLTLETLKAERSDLVQAVADEAKEQMNSQASAAHDQAVASALSAERTRVSAILKKADSIGDVREAALQAIEAGASEADAEKAMKDIKLAKLQKAAEKPLGNLEESEGLKGQQDHIARASAYRAQHNCSMEVALKATAEARKK